MALVSYEAAEGIACIAVHTAAADDRAAQALGLEAAVRAACEDDAVKVLLLSGLVADFTTAEHEARRAVAAVAAAEKPVLCAMDGEVSGLALEMALAADVRVAGEGSAFSMPQLLAGDVPSAGGTQRLSRLVGRAKALEMLLLGEKLSAPEAFQIGLVNRVAPAGVALGVARDIAAKIAAKAPIAVRYLKEAVLKGLDMPLEQGLRLEADLYFIIQTTRDRDEGLRAFAEKRPPRFRGE